MVTSFEFQLRPLGEVIGGTVAHPAERAADVLNFFSVFAEQAPDELTPMAYFFTAPDLDVLPARIRGRAIASIGVCYTGDHVRAEALLAPLRRFGPPLVDRIEPMPPPSCSDSSTLARCRASRTTGARGTCARCLPRPSRPWLTSSNGSYVNFLGDEGDARVRAAYSASGYARLASIKSTHDPTNFFRVNQNIPPAPGATLST